MIKLINGRGQLGSALQKIIEREEIEILSNIAIYHTWNIEDKSKEVQKECFEKFVRFVDENQDTKIIFTSTYSEKENYYNYYKQLAEAYLLINHKQGYVVRLPTLIGKGVCDKFRKNEAEVFGYMEILPVEEAAREVLRIAKESSLIRSFKIDGFIIPAKIVKSLILFGKEGK